LLKLPIHDVGKAAAVLYSIMASAKATLVEPFS
jgi:hypothetical protein